MGAKVFKGCGTALLTPFKEDLSIDYQAYEKLVIRQVEQGIDFLVPLGTSGETPTLSKEEKLELLRITKANSEGKALLVGCGSNSLNATLENIALVKDYADALLVVVPFYNKPTQEGIYLYYKALAERTELPIVMYNVPGRTGANMKAETTLRIAREVKGIIGVKEASGDFQQVKQIIDQAPEAFLVLSGDDDMTFELVKAGADGVISVASNVLPKEVGRMCGLALNGELKEAEALNDKLMPLFKACFVESNPIPGKEALHQLGLCTNAVRLPLSRANENTCSRIKEVLAEWK
ncbi:MAG: 4-hydroxy-tetrahydrodipicolinate synthase [Candidatus Cryptobacteroides sp.]